MYLKFVTISITYDGCLSHGEIDDEEIVHKIPIVNTSGQYCFIKLAEILTPHLLVGRATLYVGYEDTYGKKVYDSDSDIDATNIIEGIVAKIRHHIAGVITF